MSLDYVKFSSGFEKFMPKEYRDMVEHGPFGKKVSVSQMLPTTVYIRSAPSGLEILVI